MGIEEERLMEKGQTRSESERDKSKNRRSKDELRPVEGRKEVVEKDGKM